MKFLKNPRNLIYLIILLVSPATATLADNTSTPNGMTDFVNYVSDAFRWGSGIVYSLATLVLIYAGFRYMTSVGNPEQAQKAKNLIIAAVSSIALVVLATVLIHYINPNINTSIF